VNITYLTKKRRKTVHRGDFGFARQEERQG